MPSSNLRPGFTATSHVDESALRLNLPSRANVTLTVTLLFLG